MEYSRPAGGDRFSVRGCGGRSDPAADDSDRNYAAVGLGAGHALYRLGLFSLRHPSSGGGRGMKVLYFAWVRERIGKAEETIDPPAAVRTVGELIGWLPQRGEEYARAFDRPTIIRAAIDHTHVQPDTAIAGVFR